MFEEQPLNRDEGELVEALGGLLPAPPDVSEQRLWYEAGLRAGRRRRRLWGGVAAAVVMLAAGIVTVRPKGPTVYVERIARQDVRPQPGNSTSVTGSGATTASMDYVRLRDAVEQRGLDALDESGSGGAMSQPTLRAWSPQRAGSVPSPWDSINTKG